MPIAYFQDLRSKYVLKFEGQWDIDELRRQTGDYREVSEKEFNECHGIKPEQKTLTLPKK